MAATRKTQNQVFTFSKHMYRVTMQSPGGGRYFEEVTSLTKLGAMNIAESRNPGHKAIDACIKQ